MLTYQLTMRLINKMRS